MRYFLGPMAVDEDYVFMHNYIPVQAETAVKKKIIHKSPPSPPVHKTLISPSSCMASGQPCFPKTFHLIFDFFPIFLQRRNALDLRMTYRSANKPLNAQVREKIPQSMGSLRGPKTQICRTRA